MLASTRIARFEHPLGDTRGHIESPTFGPTVLERVCAEAIRAGKARHQWPLAVRILLAVRPPTTAASSTGSRSSQEGETRQSTVKRR